MAVLFFQTGKRFLRIIRYGIPLRSELAVAGRRNLGECFPGRILKEQHKKLRGAFLNDKCMA